MNKRDAQLVLAKAGLYKGAIDGIQGPKMNAAIDAAFDGDGRGWSEKRQLVGAVQACLKAMGHDPGVVDGYYGHVTDEALTQFKSALAGVSATTDFTGLRNSPSPTTLPRQSDIRGTYGDPGDSSNMAVFRLPFKMRIDWNLSQRTDKLRLHKKCGAAAVSALTEVRDHYGPAKFAEMGMDRYAGGYVPRKMRGGSKWSMHAYGCALDIYAQPNGLRMTADQALFGRPEYKPFLDIMEKHGWLNALRLWNADAMHFQMARL